MRSIDRPVGDSAGFLSWMIGKEAKKDIKVLISGSGADEMWGGYQRHTAFDFYLKQKEILLPIKDSVKKLPLNRQWSKFFNVIDPDSRRTFLNFSALLPFSKDIFDDYERLFPENHLQ